MPHNFTTSIVVQDDSLWMVLPYIQGGSVESAMKYAFPKVWIHLDNMRHAKP